MLQGTEGIGGRAAAENQWEGKRVPRRSHVVGEEPNPRWSAGTLRGKSPLALPRHPWHPPLPQSFTCCPACPWHPRAQLDTALLRTSQARCIKESNTRY